MCFDLDSSPPVPSVAGGAIEHEELTLTAADGNRLRAFSARAAAPTGAGIVIVPDIRGLHRFYEELTLRFAEHGIDAVAIDLFGRTAGSGPRDDSFDGPAHAGRTSWAGVGADIAAGVDRLRSPAGGAVRSVFTVGFCFGGRLAFLSATLGLGLAGVIGFYGSPVGPRPGSDLPAPADVAGAMAAPVLGLFGGTDQSITAGAISTFDRALTDAGVDHDLVTYPDAPHSFFDRKAAQFAAESADAWERVTRFIATRTAG